MPATPEIEEGWHQVLKSPVHGEFSETVCVEAGDQVGQTLNPTHMLRPSHL